MSHPSQVIVVRGKRAKVHGDRWMGAAVLDLLAGGPDEVRRWLESVGEADADDYLRDDTEAGFLVDFDRRVLLCHGDPTTGYVGELEGDRIGGDLASWEAKVRPAWIDASFRFEWVERDRYVAHLREHRIRFPERPPPQVPDELDELKRRLDDELARLERERPRPLGPEEPTEPAPKRTDGDRGGTYRFVVLLVLGVPLAILGLVARLLTWPVRARLREALKNRQQRRWRKDRAETLRQVLERCAAVERAPHDPVALVARGEGFLACGRLAEAEDDFDRAASLLRETEQERVGELTMAMAIHDRGVARKRAGKHTRGDADLARAKELGFRPKPAKRRGVPLTLMVPGFLFLLAAGLVVED